MLNTNLCLSRFKILKEFCGNSLNNVYLVQSPNSGQLFVYKSIRLIQSKQIREPRIHQRLRHELVVELLEFNVTESAIDLLIEYLPGGDLFDFLSKSHGLGEKQLLELFAKIVTGVDFIHARGFVHRDIKPENILLTSDFTPKIADFGFSVSQKRIGNTVSGTRQFMAPEVLLGSRQTSKVDVWSLGVLLFKITQSKYPFENYNIFHTMYLVKNSQLDFEKPVSERVKQLISKMLRVDPLERPSTRDILEELKPINKKGIKKPEKNFKNCSNKNTNFEFACDSQNIVEEDCSMRQLQSLSNVYKNKQTRLSKKFTLFGFSKQKNVNAKEKLVTHSTSVNKLKADVKTIKKCLADKNFKLVTSFNQSTCSKKPAKESFFPKSVGQLIKKYKCLTRKKTASNSGYIVWKGVQKRVANKEVCKKHFCNRKKLLKRKKARVSLSNSLFVTTKGTMLKTEYFEKEMLAGFSKVPKNFQNGLPKETLQRLSPKILKPFIKNYSCETFGKKELVNYFLPANVLKAKTLKKGTKVNLKAKKSFNDFSFYYFLKHCTGTSFGVHRKLKSGSRSRRQN